MTKDQELELKDVLSRFQLESSPIKHILTLKSFFFSRFTEEREKLLAKQKKCSEKLEALAKKKAEATEAK